MVGMGPGTEASFGDRASAFWTGRVGQEEALYSDRQKYLSTTRTQVRVLCPAVTMSMTTPGYFVQELHRQAVPHRRHHPGWRPPEGIELPEREVGLIHEVEDREENPQPRKRPGRTRGKMKLLQVESKAEVVDWGRSSMNGS